jgi:hypothetical protein
MGWPISIKKAMEDGLGVLLDANVLMDAMKEGQQGGPLRQLIVAVDFNKRFVSELVLWEFLCDAQIQNTDRAARRKWLDELHIQRREQPSGYLQTLLALTGNSSARGGGVDAQLAAYSVCTKGSLAIATNNVKDFCWHDAIPLVDDFVTTSKTPFDCK